jgi:hypothetical protein
MLAAIRNSTPWKDFRICRLLRLEPSVALTRMGDGGTNVQAGLLWWCAPEPSPRARTIVTRMGAETLAQHGLGAGSRRSDAQGGYELR